MGVATLLAALLPRVLDRLPISMPVIFLFAGFAAFLVIDDFPDPDLVGGDTGFALHLTELCVIVALMGAGLALDRPIGWRRWMSTWRLLGITMPLTMLAVGLLGGWLLGLGVAAAVLLAAVLAPTDPVLATEVQVAAPSEETDREDEPRFALTSEAGLNDSLAFPFVYAAMAILAAGAAPSGWLGEWLLVDVGWRIVVGVGVGLLVGWLLRRLFFWTRNERFRLADHAEGFVALAATFLAYGAAELAEGYGFLAVFVCACAIRSGERSHGYHRVLHQFVEQLERMLTVLILVLLGGAVARGVLDDIGWQEIVIAAVFLLVIRPVAGWLGLLGGRTGPRDRAVVAFFGVRGVGSVFYIAYAFDNAAFPGQDRLWSLVALIVIGSVVLHGITATPIMRMLDQRRRSTAYRVHGDPDQAPFTPV